MLDDSSLNKLPDTIDKDDEEYLPTVYDEKPENNSCSGSKYSNREVGRNKDTDLLDALSRRDFLALSLTGSTVAAGAFLAGFSSSSVFDFLEGYRSHEDSLVYDENELEEFGEENPYYQSEVESLLEMPGDEVRLEYDGEEQIYFARAGGEKLEVEERFYRSFTKS